MTVLGNEQIAGGYYDEVTFTHTDGNNYTFKTEPNPLNGEQMWYFDPLHSMYSGTKAMAKLIAANLRSYNKGLFKPESK